MAVKIYTRADMRLALPITSRLQTRTSSHLVGITFHHTASGADHPIDRWRAIQGAAMAGSLPSGDRYGDIPYHGGITFAGDILQGRDPKYVGAHATSAHNVANVTTDGVALIANNEPLPEKVKQAIRVYIYLWTAGHGYRPQLFDHADWKAQGGIATACPGLPLAAFIDQLRREARAGQ